jgi:hypothetical protein
MPKLPAMIFLTLLSAAEAHADEPTNTLMIYALGIGIGGEAQVGAFSADIDVSASEVLDHLELGAMVAYRWESDTWSIQADSIFASLAGEQEGSLGITRTTLDLDQLMLELDGGYRLNDNFEVLFGLRYWDFDTTITVHADLPPPPAQVVTSEQRSRDWVDPLVGMRAVAPINDKWSFIARGDVGGFGVGSDFAWSATAFFHWRTGENFSVAFGYRIFDFDFDDRGALNSFGLDMQQSGPGAAIAWTF